MIGVVCAGAGARGAYEAGALSVLLPRLFSDFPDEQVVLLGTSAGAINTALFAGVLDRERPPEEAVDEALELWRQAQPSEVFTRLRSTAPRLAVRYALELLGVPAMDSLLDSSPLRHTLEQKMDWDRLHANLAGAGRIHAAAVVATDCTDGGSEVFLEGRVPKPPPDEGQGLFYRPVALQPVHVQASAAIPVAFLPVEIPRDGGSAWYIDGGVRLNAPIRPALDLGATRVVVVATTPDPTSPQYGRFAGRRHDVFSVALVALRSLLVDRMAEDVRHLRQVNALVAAAAGSPAEAAQRSRPFRHVPNLYVGPHQPDALGHAARRVFDQYYQGPAARFSDLGVLATLLGGVKGDHAELFSFLFFDGRFHRVLIDMGRRDAERALAGGWA
ncbi:MAG TPA: patatin-like phospholipase family protein [Acidimicrobiales bacterium]|nr:patatin-like phospholipase family protein [Acidimicrobiales bacterium]